MHYCRSEADVDRKSDQLCRYCQVLLQDELRTGPRLKNEAAGQRCGSCRTAYVAATLRPQKSAHQRLQPSCGKWPKISAWQAGRRRGRGACLFFSHLVELGDFAGP